MTQESIADKRRIEVLYDRSSDIRDLGRFIVDGAEQTPTAATLDVYSPGNTQLVSAGAVVTIAGPMLQYNFDTSTEANWPIDVNYRGELTITYSSKTYYRTFYFDIVRRRIEWPISVDDIPSAWRVTGSTHARHVQEAVAWVENQIRTHLLPNGARLSPGMVTNDSDFLQAAIYYLHSVVCRDNATAQNDFYDVRETQYWQRARDAMTAALRIVDIDADQDKIADIPTQEMGGLRFNRTRRRREIEAGR